MKRKIDWGLILVVLGAVLLIAGQIHNWHACGKAFCL